MEDELDLTTGLWLKDIPYSCRVTQSGELERRYIVPDGHTSYTSTSIVIPPDTKRELFYVYDPSTPQGTIRVNGKRFLHRSRKEFVVPRFNTFVCLDGTKKTAFILPPCDRIEDVECPVYLDGIRYTNALHVSKDLKTRAIVKTATVLANIHAEYSRHLKSKRRVTSNVKMGCSVISKHIKRATMAMLGKTIQVRNLSKVTDPIFVDARQDCKSDPPEAMDSYKHPEFIELSIYFNLLLINNERVVSVEEDDYCEEACAMMTLTPEIKFAFDEEVEYAADFFESGFSLSTGFIRAVFASYRHNTLSLKKMFEDVTRALDVAFSSSVLSHMVVLLVLRRVFSKVEGVCASGIMRVFGMDYTFSNNQESKVEFSLGSPKTVTLTSGDGLIDIRWWKPISSQITISHRDSFAVVRRVDTLPATYDVREGPEYPYVYKTLQEGSTHEMFLRIRETSHFTSGIVDRVWPDDYLKSDCLSDFFSAEERMKCKKSSKTQSPIDHWYSLSSERRQELLSGGIMKADDYLYGWVCNSFNPTFYVSILRHLLQDVKDVRVLDPSAGWGDRLIGALAANVKEYLGFDPNTNLQRSYANIISSLSHLSSTKCEVIPSTFYAPPIKDYDIAITSPPYYILEEYAGSERNLRMSYEEWMKQVYIPYLDAIVESVKVGGWIVLYVETVSVKGKRYTLAEDTIAHYHFLERHPDLGLRVFPNTKVRHAYVWKKVTVIHPPQRIATSKTFSEVGIKTFGKYASFFPKTAFTGERIDYNLTSIVESSLFSTSPHEEILSYGQFIVDAVKLIGLRCEDATITDACAGIGGDTFGFATLKFKKIVSVELDEVTCNVLKGNVDALHMPREVCEVMCANYIDVMTTLSQDIVYIDAPWGGRDYRTKSQISISISNVSLEDVVLKVSEMGVKCIIIKVPPSFNTIDIDGYVKELKNVTRRVFDKTTNTPTTRIAYTLHAFIKK